MDWVSTDEFLKSQHECKGANEESKPAEFRKLTFRLPFNRASRDTKHSTFEKPNEHTYEWRAVFGGKRRPVLLIMLSGSSLGCRRVMACKSCRSNNQSTFSAEINIHFHGAKNLERPALLVFPKLLVCLDCGFAEFTIPENELWYLAKSNAA